MEITRWEVTKRDRAIAGIIRNRPGKRMLSRELFEAMLKAFCNEQGIDYDELGEMVDQEEIAENSTAIQQ